MNYAKAFDALYFASSHMKKAVPSSVVREAALAVVRAGGMREALSEIDGVFARFMKDTVNPSWDGSIG